MDFYVKYLNVNSYVKYLDVDSYVKYLDACRLIARDTDSQLRTLDRAMWQWSKNKAKEGRRAGYCGRTDLLRQSLLACGFGVACGRSPGGGVTA